MIGEVKRDAVFWHSFFYNDALRRANELSKDPRRKVGAVIVDNERRDISHGYNGFPKGVSDDKTRLLDQDLKRKLSVHAELNAILSSPTSVRGCVIYITRFPCHECAKAIIQSGLRMVVAPRPDFDHPHWGASYKLAWEILNEAEVTILPLSVVKEPGQ